MQTMSTNKCWKPENVSIEIKNKVIYFLGLKKAP